MNSQKKTLKKNSSKLKQQQIIENLPPGNTLTMGELDLIFEINFTDQELENPKARDDDPKKFYKLENLYTIRDLSFISSLPNDFINRIKLKPNNHLLRQLLLGNKISRKKNIIEFICFNRPLFDEDDERFFQRIFDKVCYNYNLNINKKPLHQDGRYSLVLKLKHKDEYKEIIKGQTPKMFREKKYKKDKEQRDLDEVNENDKEEIEQKEREEKKKEKIEDYREERAKIKSQSLIKSNSDNNNSNNINNQSQSLNNKSQSPEKSRSKSRSPNKSPKKQKNKKKEEKKEKEESSDEEDIQEDEDYDMNEAMKEKKIPKFKRKNSILCNLFPSSNKYDLFFLNFEMIKIIPGDFIMKDFIELLCFFKKKKIFIYINFFKEEMEEDEVEEEQKQLEYIILKQERKKEKERKLLEEKKNKEEEIIIMKKTIEKLKERKKDISENKKQEVINMTKKRKIEEISKIDTELDKLETDLIEKQDDLRAEQELDIEYKKKEEINKKLEEKKQKKQEEKQIKILNDIYYLTDAYFFDSKQACDIFTQHYLHNTKETDKTKKINRQKLYDYFITVISRGLRPFVEGKKLGLFMDDFNKYCIIYTSNKEANKQELNPQPYPKVNTHNIDLVNNYKFILMKFKNDYYDVFISLSQHEISNNHGNITMEIIYPTFLASVDIVKRQVELEKNGITSIDEDDIFRVKISEKKLKQELEKLSINGKEGNFVLDCTNKNKSTLKDYVSLFDYNLKDFFSSDIVRKNLQDKGFINSEGYIMYDPLYREVMGAKYKNHKKFKGEELKSQIRTNIKNIDVPARLQDKEYDPKKAVEKQIMPTDRKIPYIKTKKKKKRFNFGGSSSSRSVSEGEGSSSEGEKAGTENGSNIIDNEIKNNK